MVLISFSLIINNSEHPFMCLLAVCVSFLEKCLFKPLVPILLYSQFLWYWVVWAIYLFWILISCLLHYLQIFLLSCRLSFHFVDGFLVPKLLSLVRSHLFIFALYFWPWDTDPRKYCCDLCGKVFAYICLTAEEIS